jgi:hypothetical protein
MNCEYAKANAVLYCYDELADDARFELEQHIQRCKACAAEVSSVRQLQNAMAQAPLLEPTPNLLAASRMRLQETLETAEQKRDWLSWFTLDLGRLAHSIKLAPAMAMALFIIGFGLGIGATYEIVHGKGQPQIAGVTGTSVPPEEAAVTGIRSIMPQPGSNKVEISYDKVIHDKAQGSLDDPKIQQLLLFAARNNVNSGMRMDSIDLLSQKPNDEHVRRMLIYSLRFDNNVGVRLKAIESLQPFVKDDVEVRDAVLEALMNDTSPGVRTEAIHALEPVKADSSVRHVLQTLAKSDHNQYIRRKSQEVLNTVEIY